MMGGKIYAIVEWGMYAPKGLGCDRTAQTLSATDGCLVACWKVRFDCVKLAVFLLTESVKFLLKPSDCLR